MEVVKYLKKILLYRKSKRTEHKIRKKCLVYSLKHMKFYEGYMLDESSNGVGIAFKCDVFAIDDQIYFYVNPDFSFHERSSKKILAKVVGQSTFYPTTLESRPNMTDALFESYRKDAIFRYSFAFQF